MTHELSAQDTFWNGVWQVARKEVQQHIRTKRLLIIAGLILVALVLVTIVFGPRLADEGLFGGSEGSELAIENTLFIVFLGFFGMTFIQLLPIVLTSDAVCSEWSSRTIFLLLSKPVSRPAFVLGKFLGSALTVVGTLIVLLGLDYLVIQPLYEGSPTGAEMAGFLKFIGFLCVGCIALAALALFFSTVTRSTALAVLMTLGVWLVAFTFLGYLGVLINLGSDDPNEDLQQGFLYLNPGYDMTVGLSLLNPETGSATVDEVGSTPSPNIALLALLAHIVVWFGLSLLVVQKRNFE